jgi:hypothetical protein
MEIFLKYTRILLIFNSMSLFHRNSLFLGDRYWGLNKSHYEGHKLTNDHFNRKHCYLACDRFQNSSKDEKVLTDKIWRKPSLPRTNDTLHLSCHALKYACSRMNRFIDFYSIRFQHSAVGVKPTCVISSSIMEQMPIHLIKHYIKMKGGIEV